MARDMSLGSEEVSSRSLKKEDEEDIDDREGEGMCYILSPLSPWIHCLTLSDQHGADDGKTA